MNGDFTELLGELANEGELQAGNGVASFKGIGEHPTRPLYQYWMAVAILAADSTSDENFPEGWYDLKTEVYIKRRNPGWIDGFRVTTGG